MTPTLASTFGSRLVTLCDGRPGLRGGIQVQVTTPPPDLSPSPRGEGRGEGELLSTPSLHLSPSPRGEGRGEGELPSTPSLHLSPSPRGEGRGEGELPSTPPLQHSTTPPPQSPTLDFIASDETLDRFGEIISAAGWKLDNYRRNPVFQNAHQYGDIIFTLGKALITEVRMMDNRPVLFQRIEFAVDVNPIAKITHGLYSRGFLKTVSVGFAPIRWEDSQGVEHPAVGTHGLHSPQAAASALPLPSGEGRGEGDSYSPVEIQKSKSSPRFARRYLEQELLEVSAVAIPANPNALALGLKSGAIEKSDLQDLSDLLRQTLTPRPTPNPTLTALARQLRDLMRRT